jgi:predicted  nucleic acid-binding Zn-ribbon protein
MIAELENLIALQRSDLEIHAIESRLKQIPKEIADLEKEVATERANAKAAEDRLAESQKTRRALEGELELLDGKIEKYKEQLMLVKSNEEYRAMQKQIQSAKDDVSSKEDTILAKMEEAELLQEELKRRRKELEEGMEQVRKMEGELEAEASRLRSELDGKNGRREELLKLLPDDLVAQYRQIARIRGGVAVAEAKDEHCQVCHVRLRPQLFSELRSGNKILRCDNCSRILFHIAVDQTDQ